MNRDVDAPQRLFVAGLFICELMKVRARVTTDTSDFEAYLRWRTNRARGIAINDLADVAVKAYQDDVQGTWSHQFGVSAEVNEAKGTAEVTMHGDIPNWLNKGTAVRYATMKPGYISKTRPNILRSVSGGGQVAFISKSKPNPGIEARNFDQSVADWTASQAPEIIIAAWNKS